MISLGVQVNRRGRSAVRLPRPVVHRNAQAVAHRAPDRDGSQVVALPWLGAGERMPCLWKLRRLLIPNRSDGLTFALDYRSRYKISRSASGATTIPSSLARALNDLFIAAI